MVPAAPVGFSTMTDWPSTPFIRSASTRASASVGPPAGNGATMVMGREGYVCACALPTNVAAIAIAAKSLLMSHLPRQRKPRANMQMRVTYVRPKKEIGPLRERVCRRHQRCVFRRGDFGTSRRTALDRLCDLDCLRKGYDGLRPQRLRSPPRLGPNLSHDADSTGGERSLPRACQTLVSPEQAAQGTAHHRLAVAAQVLFVHCRFVRLSRFRFHRDFRPQ